MPRCPLLVVDRVVGKECSHFGRLPEHDVLGGNPHDSHDAPPLLSVRPTASSRNSRISTWRTACEIDSPHVYRPCRRRRKACTCASAVRSPRTRPARRGMSWSFSRMGTHSRCSCVATPSIPFSISYAVFCLKKKKKRSDIAIMFILTDL